MGTLLLNVNQPAVANVLHGHTFEKVERSR